MEKEKLPPYPRSVLKKEESVGTTGASKFGFAESLVGMGEKWGGRREQIWIECVPPNLCVEALTPSVMTLGGGAFGR